MPYFDEKQVTISTISNITYDDRTRPTGMRDAPEAAPSHQHSMACVMPW
jgi:hypothetical protein